MKNVLKEIRKKHKITQQQLAEAVYVTSRTIISIESGEYNPSLLLAYRISKFLNESMEDVFLLEENEKEMRK